jgi:peroxiredoxin
MEEKRIIPGEVLRDFSLIDQDKGEWKLSAFKGKRVLLSFHPLAWTQICADQMKCLERETSALESLDTIPVGISVDSVPCKAAWARELGLSKLRILSDFWPHGQVAGEMGLFREKEGFSERANILVNEQGIVVFVKVYPLTQLPDLKEVMDFIRELHHSGVEGNVPAKHCIVDLEGKAVCLEDSKNTGIQSTSERHLD